MCGSTESESRDWIAAIKKLMDAESLTILHDQLAVKMT
jgi:hypothetical protein